ncbi:FHA domain-containing protein [Lentisphaerota bacterium WC36G]|nr:FHA domain-containing protein [Lentisphaerae bacterium WC36]
MPKLICSEGLNEGQEYDFTSNDTITMGRNNKNDICIFDRQSSRFHCKIIFENDNFFLVDDNSTNGIKVNREKISGKQKLNHGDNITIGRTVFVFHDESEFDDETKDLHKTTSSPFTQTELSSTKAANLEITKTSKLRKIKTSSRGSEAGFLSFFNRIDDNL